MTEILISALVFIFGGLALFFARKSGYKSAESDILKERIENEAKERQRANKIIANVRNYSVDDLDRRLQDITAFRR